MNKLLLVCLTCCFFGCQTQIPEKQRKPLFEHFPPQKTVNNPKWGEKLQDIKNHEVFYENNFKDLVTTAHEATHDISIFFRMNEQQHYFRKINAFYVFDNKVAIIENPPIALEKVYNFIPKELKGKLFDNYFPNAGYQDNPLYIWEEWTAYVNGAEVGTDLVENELWNQGKRDTLLATLEFLVYSAALVIATQELAPLYYQTYPNFEEFFAWNAKRTWRVYKKTQKLSPFDNDLHRNYLKILKTSTQAKKLRLFLQNYVEINN
ncbi:hypothetical protein [Candidatus Uabimicrobium sp. HlEnr_7]|uniref:hypothetical protein n=1 Tax=Candidatus Uabimicrobium helgolandensis TaxID=3095367 RepID=UPI00355775BE